MTTRWRSPLLRGGAWVLLLCFAAVALAGCLGGPGTSGDGTGGADDAADDGADDGPDSTGAGPGSEGPAPDGDGTEGPVVGGDDHVRNHTHDWWRGRDRLVLMDEPLSTGTVVDDLTLQEPYRSFCAVIFVVGPTTCAHTLMFSLPVGRIVPPGTGLLNVTVDTDSDDVEDILTFMSLDYRAADMTAFEDAEEVESDAVWEVEVTEPMTDHGHTNRSVWEFALTADRWVPRTEPLALHLNVTAVRSNRSLPMEVPVDTLWPNGTRRVLLNATEQAEVARVGGTAFCMGGCPTTRWGGDEHAPVPLQTDRLVVTVNWTNTAPTRPVDDPEPVFKWKTSPGFGEEREAEPAVAVPGHYVFEVPLEGRADGLNQSESRWTFTVDFQGPGSGGPRTEFLDEGVYLFQGERTVRIVAHRLPASDR